MDIEFDTCFICCFSERDYYAFHVNGKRFFVDPADSRDYKNRGFEVHKTELNDFDKNLKLCRFCENELHKKEIENFE